MYPKTLNPHKQFCFYERYEFYGSADKLTDIYLHKNYDIGMHCHDFYEINIVLSGKGCHYINDMAIPVSGGEVFVIPPDVTHGYYCEKKLDIYHILLKSNFMEKYKDDLSKVPCFSILFEIEPYLRQVYQNFMFLSLKEKNLYEICALLDDASKYSSWEYETYKTFCTLNIINKLCILMERQQNEAEAVNDDKDILKVLEYIQSNYSSKITIEKLMEISNMSRPTLHRHFKKVTKMTPTEYIISIRVEAAKNQLADSDKSRTEIAHNLGFYDSSHMNKHLDAKKRM